MAFIPDTNVASTDLNALANNSRCIDCNIPGPEAKLAVIIYLLATLAGESTDPSSLAQKASCINCNIPPGMQMPVVIYLLTVLANQ